MKYSNSTIIATCLKLKKKMKGFKRIRAKDLAVITANIRNTLVKSTHKPLFSINLQILKPIFRNELERFENVPIFGVPFRVFI